MIRADKISKMVLFGVAKSETLQEQVNDSHIFIFEKPDLESIINGIVLILPIYYTLLHFDGAQSPSKSHGSDGFKSGTRLPNCGLSNSTTSNQLLGLLPLLLRKPLIRFNILKREPGRPLIRSGLRIQFPASRRK